MLDEISIPPNTSQAGSFIQARAVLGVFSLSQMDVIEEQKIVADEEQDPSGRRIFMTFGGNIIFTVNLQPASDVGAIVCYCVGGRYRDLMTPTASYRSIDLFIDEYQLSRLSSDRFFNQGNR